MKEVLEVILKERKSLGMTQAEFAEMVGVSEKTLFSIEKGSMARKSTLDKIADKLGYELQQKNFFTKKP